jgi:hypothetical protein
MTEITGALSNRRQTRFRRQDTGKCWKLKTPSRRLTGSCYTWMTLLWSESCNAMNSHVNWSQWHAVAQFLVLLEPASTKAHPMPTPAYPKDTECVKLYIHIPYKPWSSSCDMPHPCFQKYACPLASRELRTMRRVRGVETLHYNICTTLRPTAKITGILF